MLDRELARPAPGRPVMSARAGRHRKTDIPRKPLILNT